MISLSKVPENLLDIIRKASIVDMQRCPEFYKFMVDSVEIELANRQENKPAVDLELPFFSDRVQAVTECIVRRNAFDLLGCEVGGNFFDTLGWSIYQQGCKQ